MNRLTACLAASSLVANALCLAATPPASAVSSEVLILGSTVSGGTSSIEAQEVAALGLTPVVVDDSSWAALTATQFSAYRAIVLGDATCSSTRPAAAEANTATWGPAVTGNVLVNGTDPVFHSGQGGEDLTRRAIAFAVADATKTGLYVSLSCYYHDTTPSTPVPLLDALRPGGFTVTGVGCYNDAHIIATHPALIGLTDASLSGWGCSVHEAFDRWPADFTVLAMARDFGAAFTGSDGSVGTPYILASGAGLRSFPLSVTPTRAEATIGTTHTVTATLLDAATSNPVAGVLLRAIAADAGGGVTVATGLDCSTPLCATDNNGQVSFSYSSTSVGDDVITVWQDANADDRIDPGEARVTALVTWAKGAATKWLAIGDSYSAGVGGAPSPSDDRPANTACRTHVSASYAGQAKATAEAAGHQVVFQFAACMDATTGDILKRGQEGTDQQPQLDYVKAIKPDIVSLTIGGNDIGFPTIAKKCVASSVIPLFGCPVDSDKMTLADRQKAERKSWDGLYDRLVKTYVETRKAQPASGHLYVLSYPVPFAKKVDWDLFNIARDDCFGFSSKQTRLANAMSVRLGDTIYKAVKEANRQVGNVHFVDWRPDVTTEKLNGREQRVAYDSAGLCSRKKPADRTMNGILLPIGGFDVFDSFHPTRNGYAKGAKRLTAKIDRYTWAVP